ncbi:hypothetical protein [Arthrobacter sp. 35W]|uniref:hypothetical protein n=1 Tax=Arthrobacter sp. 35W TaxID=1132441 RepID=UPI0003FED54F|nr:hypothetical protein [Arthrobacter sp. 35W]
MPAEPSFYAPVGYSIWWPLIGVALLLLVAGWYGYVVLSTRTANAAGIPGFVPPRNPGSVQSRYLGIVDDIERRHDGGALDGRSAHQELSVAVRAFVHEMTGIAAQRMTLAELRARELPAVAAAVRQFYPAEFATADAAGTVDVHSSAAAARMVVAGWR